MPTGAKCHAPALRDHPYCYFHLRLHSRKWPTPKPKPLQLPDPTDPKAIRIGLAQVMDALASNKIDARSAGLYLYSLQLAIHHAENSIDPAPDGDAGCPGPRS